MNTMSFGSASLQSSPGKVEGDFIVHEGLEWYRIENYDRMPPFFMTIANPSNIWIFISSSGGLSCGRESSDNALLPYTTEDKINDTESVTGSSSYFIVYDGGNARLWKPFSRDWPSVYPYTRRLWKTIHGDRIMFEEENHELGLKFRMSWEASPRYGIHRRSELINTTDSVRNIRYLDGIRNILPAGVDSRTQNTFSNLLDAYKRSELDRSTGLGIFALSATLTDLAEPSESLLATTVWSWGLENSSVILSDGEISPFMQGDEPQSIVDLKGRRGSYLLTGGLELAPGENRAWGMCGELRQDHSAVQALRQRLSSEPGALSADLMDDIRRSQAELERIIALNDGIQNTGSRESSSHHRLNVLFNVMRGGYFTTGYQVYLAEFEEFVRDWNSSCHERNRAFFGQQGEMLQIDELISRADSQGDADLRRLAREFLPLSFSRRHGDPSRPWNAFRIETRMKNGRVQSAYQGNWRDIFQNWEALCLSYPLYLPSIVSKFLNATTIDGYNPYRISNKGIDWEVPNPEDPWANIGYWSDHQIIYLAKLLEHSANYLPGVLTELANEQIFSFADVPYRIKGIDQLMADPYSSIVFDGERHKIVEGRVKAEGADGRLVHGAGGDILRSGMLEKLLILLLAKLANYVPGGGIWMNTQRPEWNDANNALAGWGLSMVTLSYLLRYLESIKSLLEAGDSVLLHAETSLWIERSRQILEEKGDAAHEDETIRHEIIVELGRAAEDYRNSVYPSGFAKAPAELSADMISGMVEICSRLFHRSLEAALRDDGLFESYMVLSLEGGRARILRLYPMLEGQVAGLSVPLGESGSARKVLALLESLKNGPLYRKDQHSYMLYPNRELPGFLEKNSIRHEDLPQVLRDEKAECLKPVLLRDLHGTWHFNGNFRNFRDVQAACTACAPPVRRALEELFEKTFKHTEFTGRSGTFFAYEGLGSIYWHMVSKLLLAVQEQLVGALERGENASVVQELKLRYLDIRAGLGFNKDPQTYGAFPIDPYSHTPWGRGAQQPGMTGQVKEELITRFGELGLAVRNGRIRFIPSLVLDDQWRRESEDLEFQFCGVPVRVLRNGTPGFTLSLKSGEKVTVPGHELDAEHSRLIFQRAEEISALEIGAGLQGHSA